MPKSKPVSVSVEVAKGLEYLEALAGLRNQADFTMPKDWDARDVFRMNLEDDSASIVHCQLAGYNETARWIRANREREYPLWTNAGHVIGKVK